MPRKTVLDIQAMQGVDKISMLTAYDYPTASILDHAGIDMILVGDSLGNVILGHTDTLAVSLDQIIHHTSAVVKGTQQCMVVADMPFGSFQISTKKATAHAIDLIAQSGAQAVKLEGGQHMRKTIAKITRAGVPVMGHVGLTPQSVHQLGGFKIQGKTPTSAEAILQDALAVEQAGAFAIVLECIPKELANTITERLSIPTIGIGSGAGTDGQVLVFHDLVGLTNQKVPSFVQPVANMHEELVGHVKTYIARTREQ